MIRVGKIFVVVSLAAMLGLHWALLQSVAWTTMLAENLRTHSLAEAVTDTFDGKHPCCLCKAITAAKKSEKQSEFSLQAQKLEFLPAKENPVLIAPSSFQLVPQANFFAESLDQRPPTPPPRGAFV